MVVVNDRNRRRRCITTSEDFMPPFSTARIFVGDVSTVRTVGYKYPVRFADSRIAESQPDPVLASTEATKAARSALHWSPLRATGTEKQNTKNAGLANAFAAGPPSSRSSATRNQTSEWIEITSKARPATPSTRCSPQLRPISKTG